MIKRVVVIFLLALMAGCSTGDDDFTSDNTVQQLIGGEEAYRFDLLSGAYVYFPAWTFAFGTSIRVSDQLTDADSLVNVEFSANVDKQVDPVPQLVPIIKDSGDPVYDPGNAALDESYKIAGLVINSPVEALFERDLEIKFHIPDPVDENVDLNLTEGAQYYVYRYDFYDDYGRWIRWGNNYAVTALEDGEWYAYCNMQSTADVTGGLPDNPLKTTDFRGFLGTIALFDGLARNPDGTTDVDTVFNIEVLNTSSQQIATNASFYAMIGAKLLPLEIGASGHPSQLGISPDDPLAVEGVENYFHYDPATGATSFIVPDYMVSKLIAIRVGREDENIGEEDTFVVVRNGVDAAADNNMVVEFGTNTVSFRGIN